MSVNVVIEEPQLLSRSWSVFEGCLAGVSLMVEEYKCGFTGWAMPIMIP